MPRRCTACDSTERKAIDLILASGTESNRKVAAKFGLSETAVHRHKKAHLRPTLLRAAGLREELSAKALVDRLVQLTETTDRLLVQAVEANDRAAAGKLIRESRENVIAIGRTLGMWQQGSSTVINDNRVQIAALKELSVDELRALASMAKPALPGDVVDAEIVGHVPSGQATDERNAPSDGLAET